MGSFERTTPLPEGKLRLSAFSCSATYWSCCRWAESYFNKEGTRHQRHEIESALDSTRYDARLDPDRAKGSRNSHSEWWNSPQQSSLRKVVPRDRLRQQESTQYDSCQIHCPRRVRNEPEVMERTSTYDRSSSDSCEIDVRRADEVFCLDTSRRNGIPLVWKRNRIFLSQDDDSRPSTQDIRDARDVNRASTPFFDPGEFIEQWHTALQIGLQNGVESVQFGQRGPVRQETYSSDGSITLVDGEHEWLASNQDLPACSLRMDQAIGEVMTILNGCAGMDMYS